MLVLLALFAAFMNGSVLAVRQYSQSHLDSKRKTYILHHRHGLDEESVVSLIRSLSGTLRRHGMRWRGVPTVAFEMWAESTGITYRLRLPWEYEEFVIPLLRSREIDVTPDPSPPHYEWTRSVALRLTHSSHPLRIPSPSEASLNLLASVQALKDGEAVMHQWIVTPAVPKALPVHKETSTEHLTAGILTGNNLASKDEVNARRQKLQEANLQCALNMAAKAATVTRAVHLLHRGRDALATTRGPHTHFERRFIGQRRLQEQIDMASAPMFFPITLSATELASLLAYPMNNPHVSGLPPITARHLPVPGVVPRTGIVFGASNFPGDERPVAIPFDELTKHLHVMGASGTGKTELLNGLARQIMEAKTPDGGRYGLVMMDPKGDLFERILDVVPPERLTDVRILNVQDDRYPVGFNILHQGDPLVAVDDICDLFDHLYRDRLSVYSQEALYHGLRTLILDPAATFIDLLTLFRPNPEQMAWADNLRRKATEPELRQFWQMYENKREVDQDRFVQPLADRVWQLTNRSKLRHIIGQSSSSYQMTDVIQQNKINFIHLAGLEEKTLALTGTLVMNAIWHAVKTSKPENPNFLLLDEFQSFLELPIGADDMLAKARGFKCGMILAHQHLQQLPMDVKSAVQVNGRSKIYLGTSTDDARAMAREMEPLEEHDFKNFLKFEGAARIVTPSRVSSPFTFKSLPPAASYQTANLAIDLSRRTYGRPKADVVAEIENRYRQQKPPSGPQRRPEISD